MQKKRVGVIVVVLLLLLVTVVAIYKIIDMRIGNQGGVVQESTSSSSEESGPEEITLEWYVNYSWFTTQWGGNVVSDAITEQTGVNVNFVTPIGNETEKLNALIASDTLPDIITLGYWETQVDEMIEADMVYALNELADEYDPYFWKVADEDVVKWYTKEDGNIYAYPNSSITPQDLEENSNIRSNQTFLVRKDIYEAIGSPDMSTPEKFKAAVKKAADMFPEVDGNSLIPVGAHVFDGVGNVSFDKYLMNFLAIPWEKDGKYYDRYTDPEYITWLKMFRELGEEGLLAPDIFVDTRTQMEEKLAEGRYFCMLYQYTDIMDQQKILYEKDPNMIYMAVDGPRNSNGDDPTLSATDINGWTVTMISKSCENPDRAIQFISYLMSEEGQKCTYLGVEGETYDVIDGVPVVKEEVSDLLKKDRISYDAQYGADNTYWMMQNNVMQQQWEQASSPAEEQLMQWAKQYVVYSGQYEIKFENNSEAGIAMAKINELWSKVLPELLMASSEEEFDRILADFVTTREGYGYQRYLDAATEYMNQAKAILGL